MSIDVRDPFLTSTPTEWEAIPPEILERLLPVTVHTVVGPDRREHVFDMRGMLTAEQKRQIDKIAAARWFLLKNDGYTGRLRCARCKQTHAYFTLACVERPFHGLQEIVGLMRKVVGQDMVFDAVRLGTLVPISRDRAQRLASRIRGRGEQL